MEVRNARQFSIATAVTTPTTIRQQVSLPQATAREAPPVEEIVDGAALLLLPPPLLATLVIAGAVTDADAEESPRRRGRKRKRRAERRDDGDTAHGQRWEVKLAGWVKLAGADTKVVGSKS
ncbi:hypothetical protein C8R45DRAFT_1106078 [Mycena sanguinolenta]|nr:hypothetical protein C8R45DRAFT_1106078 [Mycena sanguinolenta]